MASQKNNYFMTFPFEKCKYIECVVEGISKGEFCQQIIVKGKYYAITIDIDYIGNGQLTSRECSQLGLPLSYNSYVLHKLNTYDFSITATLEYLPYDLTKLSPQQLAFPENVLTNIQRDFDWVKLKDSLSFSAYKTGIFPQ